jgi:GH24 family phage-related lysozyme (muramidase)
MRISDNGIKLIKHFEGVRNRPYRDAIGLWTCGVGHLIGDGKQLPDSYNKTFTDKEVDDLLRKDLARFERGVTMLFPVSYRFTQGMFDALCSFAFNLGIGALQRSTVRSALLRNDKKMAGESLLRYCRAGGKILKGLQLRRQAEYKLLMT